MAGDWIAWTKGLLRKPEVVRIAAAIETDRYCAACHLMGVWEWADENTADGKVAGFTVGMLDEAVGVPGIGKAMADVGWLEVSGIGLTFPNWDRYNSESAKKRLQERDRKRRQRAATQPTKRY